jgi:hypothetical protein
MTSEIVGYIFGYGSLADPEDWLIAPRSDLPEGVYGVLEGFCRHWDVALKNDHSRHDHKYYKDSDSGDRVEGYVATLGISAEPGAWCNGVAVPVDSDLLAKFDKREGLLYDRSADIRDKFSQHLERPLWAYVPDQAALDSFENGLSTESVWLPVEYYERVREVFDTLDESGLHSFEASTRDLRCPLRKMELHRAPGDLGI